jgi:hypothetical protein
MAVFNVAKREIDLKIVYCGAALCGKTTNLQFVHKILGPQCGELLSLPTKDDRTLFFDFLLMERYISGLKTRFHLYTVPGQVQYALTRRAVLVGVDGVVFVVDSQTDKLKDNIASLHDLGEQLRFYKKDLATLPMVLQYNKRDLPDIMTVEDLNAAFNRLEVPVFESCAVTGKGVAATLNAICTMVQKHYEASSGMKKR